VSASVQPLGPFLLITLVDVQEVGMLGEQHAESLNRALNAVFCSMQAHGPCLLITLVGVQPALQCRGIGSRLLERVLRYADEHSLPSYLEVCADGCARRCDIVRGMVWA
jgi:GNAT superfamily N-acetyltransferase